MPLNTIGNGMCVDNNVCQCNAGWSSLNCSVATCASQNYCSGNGKCIGYNLCQCNTNWLGDSCATPDCSSLNDCSNTGVCVQPNVCQCSQGYSGLDCSQLTSNCSSTSLNNCSQHGICINSACRCFTGYFGQKCDQIACDQVQNCSDNGICQEPNVCQCNLAFEGLLCESPTCATLNRCSFNGVCQLNQTCSCLQGYSGADCSQFSCSLVNSCSGHGVCTAPNVCLCNQGYDGLSCQYYIGSNLNAPVFANSLYGIAVDEYLELNSFLLSIQATDADLGRNGIVKYLLLPVLDYVYFSVDSTSGNVSLANYLTNTASSTLTFRVQAYDQGTPKMTDNTDVTVSINHVKLSNTCNDILNSTQVSFEYFLDEIASQIHTIPLKPASLDFTRNVTYYLDTTNDNNVKAAISINLSSGVFSVSQSIATGLYQILADGHEKFNDTAIACDTQITISLLIKPPLGDYNQIALN